MRDPNWPRCCLGLADLSRMICTFSWKVILCGPRWGEFYELTNGWVCMLLGGNLHPHAPSLSNAGSRGWASSTELTSWSLLCDWGWWSRLWVQPWLCRGCGAALGVLGIPCCSKAATHSPGCTCWAQDYYWEIGRIQWLFHTEVSSEHSETVLTIVWNTVVCSNSLVFLAEVNYSLMSPIWFQCLM